MKIRRNATRIQGTCQILAPHRTKRARERKEVARKPKRFAPFWAHLSRACEQQESEDSQEKGEEEATDEQKGALCGLESNGRWRGEDGLWFGRC